MTLSSDNGDSPNTVLSVRAEVFRAVDPDAGELSVHIGVTRESKSESLQAAALVLEGLKSDLGALGGVVKTASTSRHPLAWSTQRGSTADEWDPERKAKSGRTVTNVAVRLSVRDFDLLERIEALAATSTSLRIVGANWTVDGDNPAWNELRHEAIQEALRKGEDYARALKSRLISLEHVADVGLLTSNRADFAPMGVARGAQTVPQLDPVPVEISAAIEARFRIATVLMDSSN